MPRHYQVTMENGEPLYIDCDGGPETSDKYVIQHAIREKLDAVNPMKPEVRRYDVYELRLKQGEVISEYAFEIEVTCPIRDLHVLEFVELRDKTLAELPSPFGQFVLELSHDTVKDVPYFDQLQFIMDVVEKLRVCIEKNL